MAISSNELICLVSDYRQNNDKNHKNHISVGFNTLPLSFVGFWGNFERPPIESMLVITALVGTRDLGQEVYIALIKADSGRGIIAGLSIAFIAIIADRILSASARHARARLGLE